MKTFHVLYFTAICFLFLTIVSFAADAPDSDRSCYLQAPPQDDVYVTVYNEDGEGNRTSMIWQGTIPAGQEKLITSELGRIRYDFSFSPDQPSEGGNFRWCNGMDSIGVMP